MKLSTSLIYSSYADDPDFKDLLDEFVARIPERVMSMRAMILQQDSPHLITIVHQLRGACGSYGFHQLTQQAEVLESLLQASDLNDDLKTQLESFLESCGRLTSSPNQQDL